MSDSERDAREVNSPEKQLPLSPAKSAAASVTSAAIAVEVAGARIGRCRWMICALVFFAATLNYLDRQVIATLKPTLQGQLGWSEIDYSNIVFAFQLAYAIVAMRLKTKERELSRGGDGLRADIDGNIWVGAWGGEGFDGVHVFAPDGQRIGQILLPEATSNVCFGGLKRNRLFIAASQSLYSVYVGTQGAHIA